MKNSITIFVVFCCFSVVVSELGSVCETNNDCGEGECCVNYIHQFVPPRCKRLREQDEFCFPVLDSHLEDGKYKYMCPCNKGLQCKSEKIEEEDGTTTFINAKCAQ